MIADDRVTLSKTPNKRYGEVYDMRGEIFGELTVISFAGKDKQGRAKWLCKCSCGVSKVISARSLKSGSTISCGHVNRANSAERMRKLSTTHGASHEPWFNNYLAMVNRITNKKYHGYDNYHNKIKGKLIEDSWLINPWEFYK